MIVGVSFPPLIGHSTLLTLCGFAFGMKGFAIGAGGSLVGSALVFVLLRLCFSSRLRRWSSHNEKWQALESVVVRTGCLEIWLFVDHRRLSAQRDFRSSFSFAFPLSPLGSTLILCLQ